MPFPWIVSRIRNVIHEECSRTQQLSSSRAVDDSQLLQQQPSPSSPPLGSYSPSSSHEPPSAASSLLFAGGNNLLLNLNSLAAITATASSSSGQQQQHQPRRQSQSPPAAGAASRFTRERQDSSSSGGESPPSGAITTIAGGGLSEQQRISSLSHPNLETLDINKSSSPPSGGVAEHSQHSIFPQQPSSVQTAVAAAAASHNRTFHSGNSNNSSTTAAGITTAAVGVAESCHSSSHRSKFYGFGPMPESMIMSKGALKTIEQSFNKNKIGLGKDGSKMHTTQAQRGGPSTGTGNDMVDITYTDLNVIGNGSFGVVFQARLVNEDCKVAIKKVFQDKRFKNRELQIMRDLDHPNVVKLLYFFYSQCEKDNVYLNLVLEYVPETVYRIARHHQKQKQSIPLIYVQLYMYQLFRALAYIHSIGICHRDIKPQNLLVDTESAVLKLCDFGSAKHLVRGEPNVSYICSRYYRAPELIFGASDYTVAIDIWSAGCVMAELILGQPIFPGDSGVDQLVEIIKVLGTPSKEEIQQMNPNYCEFKFPTIKAHPWAKVFRGATTEQAMELTSLLLKYTPPSRISPLEACTHTFFDDLRNPLTKLPNQRPLPPLFNLNQCELLIQPNLNHILVPEHAKGSLPQQQQSSASNTTNSSTAAPNTNSSNVNKPIASANFAADTNAVAAVVATPSNTTTNNNSNNNNSGILAAYAGGGGGGEGQTDEAARMQAAAAAAASNGPSAAAVSQQQQQQNLAQAATLSS